MKAFKEIAAELSKETNDIRELKQTRRRRKREPHLKMLLRVSAVIFQLFKLIMLEKCVYNYPGIKLKPTLGK